MAFHNTKLGKLAVFALFIVGLLGVGDVNAQGAEAKLKAAYVANMASFVRWPDEPQKVRLCFSKHSSLAPSLAAINGHSLGRGRIIEAVASPETIKGCHVLYSDLASGTLFNATAVAAQRQVLTISDMPSALSKGYTVQLFVRNLRLRFAINAESLERADYQISSKLLRLARQLD